MILYTIGYEATTMAEFIAALTRAGVTQVIDIRALPLSRRPGFSKSPLAASLPRAAGRSGLVGCSIFFAEKMHVVVGS